MVKGCGSLQILSQGTCRVGGEVQYCTGEMRFLVLYIPQVYQYIGCRAPTFSTELRRKYDAVIARQYEMG